MSSPIRVRFAPSPTGYLHVGGARTALFNYLFAKHHGGVFIVRIEDTDQSRFQQGALEEIYKSLEWLGLAWDEGPGKEGAHGPYIQSQRCALYKEYADKLLSEGKAYRCFCSAERLAQVRLEREKNKLATGYDRFCRDIPEAKQRELADSGAPFVVRFKIPLDRKVIFSDEIRGPIEYSTDVLDDLVLLKSDGFPTYHLANVVDDHCMEISHVLRGDEWIASTPRHVLLYEAFGWQAPAFAHMPVILAEGGGKLSKRKGAASVMDYKRAGFLPEALFNFLALLGWSPGEGDMREKMTRAELIEAFSLKHISPKAAVFDEKKLDWMNGKYLEETAPGLLVADVASLLKEKNIVANGASIDQAYLTTVISMLKGRSKRIVDIVESAAYFFNDPEAYEEKAERKYFSKDSAGYLKSIVEKIKTLDGFSQSMIENAYAEIAASAGIMVAALIHPTRLAISGVSFGPGLFELMEVLGKEAVVRRIEKAIKKINPSTP
jgi:glutamyl-tRNA synthetase